MDCTLGVERPDNRQVQPLDGPLRGDGITVLQIARGLLNTDPGNDNSRDRG